MSKSRGYSYDFVQAVQAADPRQVGVKLGLLCINKRISVRDVAEALGVARQTVYWWFIGRFQPKPAQQAQIEKFVARYSK